jgi:hypothetical protein
MKQALVLTALSAAIAAVTVCGTKSPATPAACVVVSPPHLSATVVPPPDEVERLLAESGERYAGSLGNPSARLEFRARLRRLDSLLASGPDDRTCRAFADLSDEFHRADDAAASAPARNAFALVLDLTAATIARRAHP